MAAAPSEQHPHPTLAALYAAIVAHPGEDTPRLQYADAAEELGLVPDRVELIKAQYRLREIGPPPRAFLPERLTLMAGPRLQFVAAVEDGLRPGEWITANTIDCTVEQVSGDAATGVCRVVCRVRHGDPYPQKEAEALRARVGQLLLAHPEWQPFYTEVRLGFASHVEFAYNLYEALGPQIEALCHAHPIVSVRLNHFRGLHETVRPIALRRLREWAPRVRRWEWPGFSYDVDKDGPGE